MVKRLGKKRYTYSGTVEGFIKWGEKELEKAKAKIDPIAPRLQVEKQSKKKRAPSKYNIFMGKCVKSKSGKITTRLKKCATEWKKK